MPKSAVMRKRVINKDSGNQNKCTDSSRHHNGFAGRQQRPSAPDEPARDDSSSAASRVCRKKWNPYRQKAAAQFEALGNEVDWKPVGDEEPDRIGQHARCDGSPRFLQTQQLPQRNALMPRRRWQVSLPGSWRALQLKSMDGARGCDRTAATEEATKSRARPVR